MLILCSLLLVQIFSKYGSCAVDLRYIVRREKGGQMTPICMGEGMDKYSGIGWSYPIPKNGKLPEEVSYYLPNINNDYNCKFSYNEQCSSIWLMKNWNIDASSTRKYDFIKDERWEEFQSYYVSNSSDDSKNRIELSAAFRLGFSVRASEQIELLVCEGWDLKQYSCYYFNVTNNKIELSRHIAMSDNNANGSRILNSYKAYSNIITIDEWRNFQIGMNEKGRIFLTDMNMNRTLIEFTDKFPLRPAYFFFKSKSPSVWKIHQNSFFYTKNAQISRLGPSLRVNSEDLCINMYVSTCPNCTMRFFLMENGTRTMISQKVLRQDVDWSLVRLTKKNLLNNNMNIFVQTAYKENVENKDGLWAIDNVRVCNKNEVRISQLESLEDLTDNTSCHFVDKSYLRPTKEIYKLMEEYPEIESVSDSTSINLTWTSSKSKDLEYFITYQANDICRESLPNSLRLKSNDFFVVKSNQRSLRNLIPYTTYNITFRTLLHLREKSFLIVTKDSPYISFEEQPRKILLKNLTDTSVHIIWDEVDCRNIHGHIFYNIILTDKSNNTRFYGGLTENMKFLKDLKPYTNYTLKLTTSRSILKPEDMLKRYSLSVTFRTYPGLAPKPSNLEIYATSNDSLSLRYDIPNEQEGHPVEIHLTRCNPLTLKKCKTYQTPITPCRIYDGKFCMEINNLIPYQKQIVRISLKNDGSHTFGDEAVIEGFTEERVPGQPTNITSKLVDCVSSVEYCNLNITWMHPYNQNGTITSFNILLNTTEENVKGKMFNEIYKIKNGKYSKYYSHQIKYIPFSKKYNLYIQSVNNFLKSPFTTQTVVHTANLGDKIDQSPILAKTTDESAEFQMKPPDSRLKTTVTILVQDFDENKTVDTNLDIELVDNLCNDFGDTWISQVIKVDDVSRNVVIGKSDSSGKSLKANTKYCVTFLMENEYQNSTHQNVYYETFTTLNQIKGAQSASSNILWIILVACILIILIAALICILRRRCSKKSKTRDIEMEHAYETLPFEDNSVNNNLYNRLQHK